MESIASLISVGSVQKRIGKTSRPTEFFSLLIVRRLLSILHLSCHPRLLQCHFIFQDVQLQQLISLTRLFLLLCLEDDGNVVGGNCMDTFIQLAR